MRPHFCGLFLFISVSLYIRTFKGSIQDEKMHSSLLQTQLFKPRMEKSWNPCKTDPFGSSSVVFFSVRFREVKDSGFISGKSRF